MATDGNKRIRRPVSLDEAWSFIRERIERQQAAQRKYTLHFEVSVESDGRITCVAFQPVKERMAHEQSETT